MEWETGPFALDRCASGSVVACLVRMTRSCRRNRFDQLASEGLIESRPGRRRQRRGESLAGRSVCEIGETDNPDDDDLLEERHCRKIRNGQGRKEWLLVRRQRKEERKHPPMCNIGRTTSPREDSMLA